MRTAWRSHVGKVRQVNEDRAWTGKLENGITAAVVADGMGGHKAGDVASGLAIDSLTQSLSAWNEDLSSETSAERLREIVRKANLAVYEMASGNEEWSNMGTTVVLALANERAAMIGHIGDSRAYRMRGGELELLTEDHTLVNELAKSGQLSEEEAANHPRRNVLTRALGTDRDVAVDVSRIDWQRGDRLLLCSDGLSSLVERRLILEALKDPRADMDQIAERLITLALLAGGDDNITVALIDYGADDDAEGGAS
ncbi:MULTISPECIES: Stp1/IreP family PP2C-type Ser/Thr phosphatase [Cohnella]|uniref:Stp1/IreP family PP2C-type Ser/Thr phosphatase n=1 Tax=Cohnella TaxID=329857 RepID=UPI000360A5C4|nr:MULTISPECIES: Stp1/IreP family PP2C-type Ser/Thr phosphatase [Cohnella]REK67153.1 MAG: Stp1/IreP family PP2C-type Ser/Thr phosphatase [Cohnella sp.]